MVFFAENKNAYTMDSNISRSKYCKPVSEAVSLHTEYRFTASAVVGTATLEAYESQDLFADE